MARLPLALLLLLSLLSLSLARFQPQPQLDVVQSQPSDFLPQLPHPEHESESGALPQLPNPEIEQERETQLAEFPELEKPEEEKPEERPEAAEPETVQYIVVPVHQFRDVRNFDGLQDIGFSLRLPMRHSGRPHGHRRFGGFGHRFGHRFRHGMSRGFEGRGFQMEDDEEERRLEMPEIPRPAHMKEKMEIDRSAWNYDFTSMPMEDEEKLERVKEFMKKMRKCKHHHRHMDKDMMMHRHHEHHHGPREEPREEQREAGEEGGFIKQVMNLFNF